MHFTKPVLPPGWNLAAFFAFFLQCELLDLRELLVTFSFSRRPEPPSEAWKIGAILRRLPPARGPLGPTKTMMMKAVEQFAAQLKSADRQILAEVRKFDEWQTQQRGTAFVPDRSDDVAIRSYLLHLKVSGSGRPARQRTVASLRCFYDWAQTNHLIDKSPFDSFQFSYPLLSRSQIRRREETRFANPMDREIAHLRALNELAEDLNRSSDINTLLGTVVETLVRVMGLKTAWVFLRTEAGLFARAGAGEPPHDFALAACCGLPAGLEQDNRRDLCQPPDCHCQSLLRNGKLVRAVNIVECTRLRYAARHGGDTQGLLFHATVPLISQSRPAGLINIATEEWEFLTSADLQFLSAAGSQVGIALERARLYDLAETQRIRLEQELKMARAVQKSLLPTQPPNIPGFSLVADWRSAREVAGDFYDFILLPDGRWGFVLADVSGKGAPAALYMAMTRSLIRSEASHYSNPSSVLRGVNTRLLAESRCEMFVTVFFAVLDPAQRSLKYANAGHEPPFLRRASGRVERLTSGGPILGQFEQLTLNEETLNLERGDTVVAYTDGLTDIVNNQGEDYGHKRLADTMNSAPACAQDVLTHILKDVEAFVGTAPQPDDLTLLILTSD